MYLGSGTKYNFLKKPNEDIDKKTKQKKKQKKNETNMDELSSLRKHAYSNI